MADAKANSSHLRTAGASIAAVSPPGRTGRLGVAFLAILVAGTAPSMAHPGIGIVMDSRGNVYYTDLHHVWKLSPDGKKSIAVSNVHTHELSIDADGNIYGEHLWYEGETTDRWGHRVWRLAPDGTLTDVIPARRGFREDYGDFAFVRDRSGTMYWAVRGETTSIRMHSPEGQTSTIARHRFQDVRWMTATPGGTVYLTDLYDLVRITRDGTVETVVRQLAGWNWTRLFGTDRHAVMGLWTDPQGNVYAAVAGDREVKRVKHDGTTETVARSPFPWSPSGGLMTAGGELWLLEYSPTNAVRVRRIDAAGNITVFD